MLNNKDKYTFGMTSLQSGRPTLNKHAYMKQII